MLKEKGRGREGPKSAAGCRWAEARAAVKLAAAPPPRGPRRAEALKHETNPQCLRRAEFSREGTRESNAQSFDDAPRLEPRGSSGGAADNEWAALGKRAGWGAGAT
eukprot:COSAG04_NODE_12682_length_640_cov_0.643253_1_plen_105_part_01